MHNILGIVKVVIGQVFAIAVDGTQRELHEGDRIFAGEEIVTGANGALTVNLSDGHTMDMGRNSHWSDQSGVSAAANTDHATDDVAALQQAITDGVDPTKALDATAAGNEAPIEPGTGGGGHFIERVELTGEVVNATSGFPTNGLGSQVLDNNQFETFPAQSISSTIEALQPILTPTEIAIGAQIPVEVPLTDVQPPEIPAIELTPAEVPHTEKPPVETPHLDRPSEIPAMEQTPAEVPHTEKPPVETPHLDRPSEIPAMELTPAEVPHTEQPPVETPHLDRPSEIPAMELTPAEVPHTEQPPVETPHLDRPSEIPAMELTPAEVPHTEQPPVETPHLDRPSEIPAMELTPAEVPHTEKPPVETPHLDRPSEIPAMELTPAEVPHTEKPPVETPHLDRPSEIPAMELTPAEVPHTEQPPVETPHLDRPSEIPAMELTPAEVPHTEKPPVETPHLDRPSEIPAMELTPVEVPHTEKPPVETPHLDRPSEIPAMELTPAEEPHTEQPPVETPHLDRPSEIPAMELTPAEMPHTEQPPVETPHLDRPSEIPAMELTPAEEPHTEQPPVETPHLDRPSEIPAMELTPAEVPHTEKPPVETPHLDRPSEIPAMELTPAEMPHTEQPPVETPHLDRPSEIPAMELTPTDPSHNINITIDTIETVETPSTDKPNSVITHVNGGSESADGFDVQDGKIVSIGSNVRIYLSEGDPEPQCADPAHQIQHYNDGNQNGDGQYSDIFVVHPGSQYRQGDGTYHALNSLNGNTQSEQNGHKDYVFVQDGKDTNYQISDGTNNNSETNVNTQESVSISGSDGMGHSLQLQGINHVEGVILGDGTVHTQNKGSTSVETDTPAANPGEQHSIVTGTVTGDVALGDIVKLTINDHHYKGEVVDLGNGKLGYHIGIETGDLKEGLPVHVSITVKDEAGHYTTATADHYVNDDQVPGAPSSEAPAATESDTHTPEPHSQITHVNGGSESADGFDVQDGKIVSIGSNVHVWLSEGDSEPKCADSNSQIKYYKDGNVNGDGSHADVFVVHDGSGYTRDGNHQGLNGINGTTQLVDGGHKDYVFLQDGKESDFEFSFSSNNNVQTNVNTLDNVTVTGNGGQGLHLQGMNHLEGVIYGDGTVHTPNEGRTSISHSDAPVSVVEHSLLSAAPPAPLAEESTGHAVNEHHAEQSHSLNNLLENSDDLFLPAPAPSADSAIHQSGISDLGSDKAQHIDARINLSDLAQELEHGTDITSLIKGTEQSGSETTVIDPKVHVVPAIMSEPSGMDSLQHSSFDHLLHKPEHQY